MLCFELLCFLINLLSKTYRFSVTVNPTERTSSGQRTIGNQPLATDYVVLRVGGGSSLEARIVPSGTRVQARSEPIVLDGRNSVDRSGTSGSLTYEWSCYARGDPRRTCWPQDDAPGNVPVLRIAGNQLAPDTYTFELTVRKNGAESTATTRITLVSAQVPTVTIRAGGAVRRGSVNAYESFTLVASARSVRGRDLPDNQALWSVEPPLDRVLMNSTALTVPPNTLTSGVEYRFTYRVSDGESDDPDSTGEASRVVSRARFCIVFMSSISHMP